MTLRQLIARLIELENMGARGDLPVIQGDDYDGWANLYPEDIGVIENPFAPGQQVVAIGDLLCRSASQTGED